MNKTEFLKEISSLSREEIQKKLLEGTVKKKKIDPIIYLKPHLPINNKNDKKS